MLSWELFSLREITKPYIVKSAVTKRKVQLLSYSAKLVQLSTSASISLRLLFHIVVLISLKLPVCLVTVGY